MGMNGSIRYVATITTAVVLTVLAGMTLSVLNESDPDASAPDVVEEFEIAWNTADEARLRALFSSDATYSGGRFASIADVWKEEISFELGLNSQIEMRRCNTDQAVVTCLAVLHDNFHAAFGIPRVGELGFTIEDGKIDDLIKRFPVVESKGAWARFRKWALEHERDRYVDACGLGTRNRRCGGFLVKFVDEFSQSQQ